jgi:hypothetical protein
MDQDLLLYGTAGGRDARGVLYDEEEVETVEDVDAERGRGAWWWWWWW